MMNIYKSTIELFDKIKSHLLTQKIKSVDSAGICKYRDDFGNKCALGCLLTDDMYSPNLEGISLAHSPELRSILEPLIGVEGSEEFNNNLKMLTSLQIIHDEVGIDHWIEHINEVKRLYIIGE
jgi:hypothetical protein